MTQIRVIASAARTPRTSLTADTRMKRSRGKQDESHKSTSPKNTEMRTIYSLNWLLYRGTCRILCIKLITETSQPAISGCCVLHLPSCALLGLFMRRRRRVCGAAGGLADRWAGSTSLPKSRSLANVPSPPSLLPRAASPPRLVSCCFSFFFGGEGGGSIWRDICSRTFPPPLLVRGGLLRNCPT